MSGRQGARGGAVLDLVLALSIGGVAMLAMRAYLAPDFMISMLALDFLCR
ncbi:MAG: hypothetical protein Q7J47_21425 [Azoarcus sp.]|nr:hypothetical protein [Azoarcus sp.]